jgi:rubrerythrin
MMNRQNDNLFVIDERAVFICEQCSNSFVAEIGAVLDGEDCPVCDDVQAVQEVDTGYYHRSRPGLDCPPCIPVAGNS